MAQSELDKLVEESRRIRDELLKAAARLEVVSSQLSTASRTLNTAINPGGTDAHGSTLEDHGNTSPGGSVESEDV